MLIIGHRPAVSTIAILNLSLLQSIWRRMVNRCLQHSAATSVINAACRSKFQ